MEALIARKRSPFVHTLSGNHEDLLLQAREDPRAADLWSMNGGRQTLLSYGAPATIAGPEDLTRLAAALVRGRHLAFFQDLEESLDIGDYHFVHAGARPGVPLPRQRRSDRLWIRDPFLESREDFGRFVVHGHTAAKRPVTRANRIGLDTGAYATGVLTALVLEGAARRFLTARLDGGGSDPVSKAAL